MKPYAWWGSIKFARYQSEENDVIRIFWESENETDDDGNPIVRDYWLAVDSNCDQYNAFLEHYGEGDKQRAIELVVENTRIDDQAFMQNWQIAFDQYAERYNLVRASMKKGLLESLLNYDPDDEEDSRDLFELKIALFEREEVHNSDNRVLRANLRKAKTPMETIIAYSKFLEKENPDD